MKIEGIKIKTYNNFFDKLKGLMFKRNFNYGIKMKCNGIHTFFMKEKIDVILTDKNGKVLYIYKNLRPNRIIFPKKKVYYTYEIISGNIKKINIGDIIN